MIKKQSIEEFQKELGSKNPTPGGGVVAALSAQFAASLVEMVCNLTLGRRGYEKIQKDILKIHKDTVEFKKRLEKLAEEDKKAYDKVMAAYKIDKERAGRNDAIRKALRYAIDVPLEVREISQHLEVLAGKVTKIGNRYAVSDAKSAAHLAHAAGKAALENIKINKEALAKLQS